MESQTEKKEGRRQQNCMLKAFFHASLRSPSSFYRVYPIQSDPCFIAAHHLAKSWRNPRIAMIQLVPEKKRLSMTMEALYPWSTQPQDEQKTKKSFGQSMRQLHTVPNLHFVSKNSTLGKYPNSIICHFLGRNIQEYLPILAGKYQTKLKARLCQH